MYLAVTVSALGGGHPPLQTASPPGKQGQPRGPILAASWVGWGAVSLSLPLGLELRVPEDMWLLRTITSLAFF